MEPELGSLAEYQKVALEQRPDYKQMELMAKSGDLAVRSAKSNFWPLVSAFGQWETDQQSMGSSAGNNYIYGVNVHFEIFNGRSNQASWRKAAPNSCGQLPCGPYGQSRPLAG